MATKTAEPQVLIDENLMVTLTLPLDPNVEEGEQFEFVGVNGKNYQVKRGEQVQVPYEVFEAIYNSGRYKNL